MSYEITYYDPRDLAAWRPRDRRREDDSSLGKLYAEWNAANRRAIDEYDRREFYLLRYDRMRWRTYDH